MSEARSASDAEQVLRDEFRRHLDIFYARLKLAPPYHSVEQAVLHLTTLLQAMEPEERARLAAVPARRWELFRRAFVEAGLNQKHRGIIAGLARSRQSLDLSPEYDHFLNAFVS